MPRSNTKTVDRQPPRQFLPEFTTITQHEDREMRPRVLRLSVRAVAPGLPDEFRAALAQEIGTAGVWWNRTLRAPTAQEATELGIDPNAVAYIPEPWEGGAAMRIRYGSEGGIYRDTIADLRDGEYNIPPCTSVQVAVAYWQPSPIFYSFDKASIEVSAEIADGIAAESSPLIVTAGRRIGYDAPDQGKGKCAAPPGAYAFDINSLKHVVGKSGAKFIERDPTTGKWVPPTSPIMLSSGIVEVERSYGDDEASDGGTSFYAQITFFVR